MPDVRKFFHAHGHTDKHRKNILPDSRIDSLVMRKKRLKGAGDALPNDQFVFRVSIAFEVVNDRLNRTGVDITQDFLEPLDPTNKVVGQDGMPDWSIIEPRKFYALCHNCVIAVSVTWARSWFCFCQCGAQKMSVAAPARW